MNITPAGQRIVIQAQRALEQVELIREMAKEGKDQLSTPLRLAAIYTIGPICFQGWCRS